MHHMALQLSQYFYELMEKTLSPYYQIRSTALFGDEVQSENTQYYNR